MKHAVHSLIVTPVVSLPQDSVIEYCIGDTVTQSRKVIGYYIHVTPRMADLAIRKVFDAVASDKSLECLQEEALGGVTEPPKTDEELQ